MAKPQQHSVAGRRRWRVFVGAAVLLCIGVSGVVAFGLRDPGVNTLQGGYEACGAYSGLPEGTSPTSGMILVSGGSFRMGSDKHFPEERPQRVVSVSGFWMDRRNVWELTADDYRDQPGLQRGMKVVKGGSHLCDDNYCFRYRPSARQPAALDSGSSHIGFRTVLRQGEDHT